MDKTCISCREVKPLTDFYSVKEGKRSQRPHSYCKPCTNRKQREWDKSHPDRVKARSRRYNLKREYGMSIEDFDQMLARQDGRCSICLSPSPKWKHGWNIDHCHKTGKIRAILCSNCNKTLGLLGESIPTLHRMIQYIEQHQPAATLLQ